MQCEVTLINGVTNSVLVDVDGAHLSMPRGVEWHLVCSTLAVSDGTNFARGVSLSPRCTVVQTYNGPVLLSGWEPAAVWITGFGFALIVGVILFGVRLVRSFGRLSMPGSSD